jgi:AraC-like DNA-binding protein
MQTPHIAFPLVPGTIGKNEQSFLYTVYGTIAQHGHKAGFGVQQLARSVHLSRTQLNRKLMKLLGCSALRLIMRYRFHAARQLLCETDTPVKQISAQCGFSRHGAFCRSFVLEFNCSPSDFRNTNRHRNNGKSFPWKIPLYEKDMALLQQLVAEKTWLCNILKMVLPNLEEPFTTEQLAAASELSICTLNRKVKELFSVTPQRLLRDIKLQYACELLAASNETIAGIAYEAGFFDPAHFCRCFKTIVGCRPSDYKTFIPVASISMLKKNLMHQNGK